MNNQEILEYFPYHPFNNIRQNVEQLMKLYQSKPSRAVEDRLRRHKIGVEHTIGYGDDVSRPEGFSILHEVELSDLSEEEVAEILAKFN